MRTNVKPDSVVLFSPLGVTTDSYHLVAYVHVRRAFLVRRDLSAYLLRLGLSSVSEDGRKLLPPKKLETYLNLESKARKKGKGMWISKKSSRLCRLRDKLGL
ncbi:hypothetical protein FBUS_05754 [Fasciolopsis buskii]|uniref:TNase-like domain-containing protein n=1 Tax=Fasciolopsis buskii TaxID=27845 RepID=A0A8E0S752_9TREM|nr:hypothetical protein FBUS_05754 [Fasciolopsis buski]